MEEDINGLKIKSTFKTDANIELYKIIDFLNKTLKHKNLIFGLSQEGKKMIITVYEIGG